MKENDKLYRWLRVKGVEVCRKPSGEIERIILPPLEGETLIDAVEDSFYKGQLFDCFDCKGQESPLAKSSETPKGKRGSQKASKAENIS